MVLDGALNPALTNNELSLQQAKSFEVDLHDFFSWCNTNSAVRIGAARRSRTATTSLMSALEGGDDPPLGAHRLVRRDQTDRLRRRA